MRPGMKMMALNRIRENGRDYPRNGYGNDYREMRDNYPRNETEYETTRNEYNGSGMNYGGVEGRFRDRGGREHYDDGRFAPMRNEMRMGYPPTPYMPTYREGGQGMNPIGFLAHHDMGEQYRSDAGYQQMDEMEHRGTQMMPGMASGRSMKLTKETAEEWTKGMENEDGSRGPHWTMEQAKQVIKQKNLNVDPVEFFAVLNMLYSDYFKVFRKHNVNTVDMYTDLAMAWIDDKDAAKDKTGLYYECVVRG